MEFEGNTGVHGPTERWRSMAKWYSRKHRVIFISSFVITFCLSFGGFLTLCIVGGINDGIKDSDSSDDENAPAWAAAFFIVGLVGAMFSFIIIPVIFLAISIFYPPVRQTICTNYGSSVEALRLVMNLKNSTLLLEIHRITQNQLSVNGLVGSGFISQEHGETLSNILSQYAPKYSIQTKMESKFVEAELQSAQLKNTYDEVCQDIDNLQNSYSELHPKIVDDLPVVNASAEDFV